MKLGIEKINFKIPYCRTVFNFYAKLQFFAELGALFWNFFIDFLAFFLNVPALPEGERAKRASLTRVLTAGAPQPVGRAREAREANPRC